MPMSYTSKEQPEDKSGFNFMEDIFQPGLQGMAALYNPMMGTGFNPLTAAMGMGGGQQPSVGGILGGGLGGLLGNYMGRKFGARPTDADQAGLMGGGY